MSKGFIPEDHSSDGISMLKTSENLINKSGDMYGTTTKKTNNEIL